MDDSPDCKAHGSTSGPSGADKTRVGPMLSPWTLLSGSVHRSLVKFHMDKIKSLQIKTEEFNLIGDHSMMLNLCSFPFNIHQRDSTYIHPVHNRSVSVKWHATDRFHHLLDPNDPPSQTNNDITTMFFEHFVAMSHYRLWLCLIYLRNSYHFWTLRWYGHRKSFPMDDKVLFIIQSIVAWRCMYICSLVIPLIIQ